MGPRGFELSSFAANAAIAQVHGITAKMAADSRLRCCGGQVLLQLKQRYHLCQQERRLWLRASVSERHAAESSEEDRLKPIW